MITYRTYSKYWPPVIPTNHQEQESGRTTIRLNSSDACFQHFLFICLYRRLPLVVTSDNLNWLAREQGFASYPSGSASGLDLFYIQVMQQQATRPMWRMAIHSNSLSKVANIWVRLFVRPRGYWAERLSDNKLTWTGHPGCWLTIVCNN